MNETMPRPTGIVSEIPDQVPWTVADDCYYAFYLAAENSWLASEDDGWWGMELNTSDIVPERVAHYDLVPVAMNVERGLAIAADDFRIGDGTPAEGVITVEGDEIVMRVPIA